MLAEGDSHGGTEARRSGGLGSEWQGQRPRERERERERERQRKRKDGLFSSSILITSRQFSALLGTSQDDTAGRLDLRAPVPP
jgi:hypothetical protein